MPRLLFSCIDETLYGVLAHFTEELKGACAALGCEVDWLKSSAQPADCVISIGKVPAVEHPARSLIWLVDHPFNHGPELTQLLVEGRESVDVCCVDRTHVRAMDHFMHAEHRSFFLPHCASGERGDLHGERPIPILFAGSYFSPQVYREGIEQLPAPLRSMARKALDFALERDWVSFAEASSFDQSTSYLAQVVFQIWDRAIRAQRRLEVLEVLLDAGLPVHIVGAGWEESPLVGRAVLQPAVRHTELIPLYHQSQVVLNIGPNFPAGSHERVFSAQLAGAAVITDRNAYWEEIFTDEVEMYNFTQLEGLADRVHHLLDHKEERLAMAERGQRAVFENHLWHHRASELFAHISRRT